MPEVLPVAPRRVVGAIGSSKAAHDTANETPAASWLQGDVSAPLVWIVLLVLLAESWLFHRQGVH